MAPEVHCTLPDNPQSLELLLVTTLGLRRAGFKTRLVERRLTVPSEAFPDGVRVLSVVARQDRPSRKIRLAGFNNVG
jgi:hypothetical protein